MSQEKVTMEMINEAIWEEMIIYASSDMRLGQVIFNAVCRVAPDVANAIRATDCDPFFTDCKVAKFLDKVEELLG